MKKIIYGVLILINLIYSQTISHQQPKCRHGQWTQRAITLFGMRLYSLVMQAVCCTMWHLLAILLGQ